MRSRLKCQTFAVVADRSYIPGVSDLFAKGGRALLAGLRLPAVSRSRVDANLRLIDQFTQEIEVADRELRHLLRGDDRIRRLTAIPGIGFTTAAEVTAERAVAFGACSRRTSDHLDFCCRIRIVTGRSPHSLPIRVPPRA